MTSTSSPRTAPQRSDLIALAAHEGLSSPVGAAAALFILMAYTEDNLMCPTKANASPALSVADIAERCRGIDRDPDVDRAWFDERASAWLSSIGVEDGLARDIARGMDAIGVATAARAYDLEPGELAEDSSTRGGAAPGRSLAERARRSILFEGSARVLPRGLSRLLARIARPVRDAAPERGRTDIALMALPDPAIAGEIASAAADAPCSMALFAADRAEALQCVAALCFGARGRVQAVVLGGSVAGAYSDHATGRFVPAPEGDFDAIISDGSFFEFAATERRQRLGNARGADDAAAELGRGFGLGDRDSWPLEVQTLLRSASLMRPDGRVIAFVSSRCHRQACAAARRSLVERNLVDAVVEFRDADARGRLASATLWVLRGDRAEGEPVLLAMLAGDGLRRIEEEAGSNLYRELDSGEPESGLIERIADIVAAKREIPHLSAPIAPRDILDTAACDLRYPSYERSVDVAEHLARDAGRLERLQADLMREHEGLAGDLESFRSAIDAVARDI